MSVSVTEIETQGGRLVERVHCTYECHQDTRLSLDYDLVNENWAPGDEQEKRLPRIKNLAVDFSSVEPDDNLVVKGEVVALQEYCEVNSRCFFGFTNLLNNSSTYFHLSATATSTPRSLHWTRT